MTSVTGALREPHVGSFELTGTAAPLSSQVAGLPTLSAVALGPDVPRSTPHISNMPAKKESRKPTMAVPLFMTCLHVRPGALHAGRFKRPIRIGSRAKALSSKPITFATRARTLAPDA